GGGVGGGRGWGGPGGACGPEAWGDGGAGFGPSPPGPPDASANRGQDADGRSRGIAPGREEQPGCPVRRRRASSQDRGRDSGCIPGSDRAQCDAVGVNGGNRRMSHGAPPTPTLPTGDL